MAVEQMNRICSSDDEITQNRSYHTRKELKERNKIINASFMEYYINFS